MITYKTLFKFASRRVVKVFNPLTRNVIHEEPYVSSQEIDYLLNSQYQAYLKWKKTPLHERISQCQNLHNYIDKNQEFLANTITRTVGKPINYSYEEINKSKKLINLYCRIAPKYLDQEVIQKNGNRFRAITYDPLGLNLVQFKIKLNLAQIISGWGNPLFSALLIMIPSVLAGNSVLHKPSPYVANFVPIFNDAIRACFSPNDIIRTGLLKPSSSELILRKKFIGLCHYFGPQSTGQIILQAASHSIQTDVILEMESKDAAYIHKDADLPKAAKMLAEGIFSNSGQTIYNIERLYVHKAIKDEFIQNLLTETKKWQIGDPMLKYVYYQSYKNYNKTRIGPIKLDSIVNKAKRLVNKAKAQGAKVLVGGNEIRLFPYLGRFYQPTILLNPSQKSEFMQEQIYGPVCGIVEVESPEEAIRNINDSNYGMAASIFSQDQELAEKMAKLIEVGTVNFNLIQQLNVQLPRGGRKDSGRGYSLSGDIFHSVTNFKSLDLDF